jgi:hypothetical protein
LVKSIRSDKFVVVRFLSMIGPAASGPYVVSIKSRRKGYSWNGDAET